MQEEAELRSSRIMEQFFKTLKSRDEIVLNNFRLEAEHLEIVLPSMLGQVLQPKEAGEKETLQKRGTEKFALEPFSITIPKEEYKSRIIEVELGATASDGGTRKYSVRIGGENAPPYYTFEGSFPNPPVVSHDVFDMPVPLPKQVKSFFMEGEKDYMQSPAEWAKMRVKKFGAKMVTLHLVSTDPNVKDTPISEAMKTVEDVLQAVDVPLVIGGSGNPEKDPQLLAKAAEVCEGEKVLLNSIDLDTDYKTVAKAVKEYDQRIIALSSMNPDDMKRLNKNLMNLGVRPDQIVMDLVTGGVGYGIEYSISAMERCRLNGLRGDDALSVPIACAGSNAWGAREAWMKNDAWGPKEMRGTLWEAMTTTMAMLSGTDIFLMLDPLAIRSLESIIDSLYSDKSSRNDHIYDNWIK